MATAGPGAAAPPRGPRAEGSREEYELLIEAIYEGYLLHYGSAAGGAHAEADLGLLAGDRLYALGLARLVALGDIEAVAELADMITLSALAQGAGEPELAEAVWAAGARAVGWGSSEAHRRAKDLVFAGDPEAIEAMRTSAAGLVHAVLNRASILFARGARQARPAQVQVHRRPGDPGRLRGRDGHAPAVHDRDRPHRGRGRCRLLHAARARLCDRADLQSAAAHLGGRRLDRRLPRQQLHPGGHHAHPGDRRGRQVDRVRAQAQRRDRHRPLRPPHAVHRDLDALRASRLPGALGRRRRALHLPLSRRRLRPARAARRRTAACARSTASPRAWPAIGCELYSGRFSVNSELQRFSPRDPGEPLDGIGQYLYPSRPDARKL